MGKFKVGDYFLYSDYRSSLVSKITGTTNLGYFHEVIFTFGENTFWLDYFVIDSPLDTESIIITENQAKMIRILYV